MDVLERQSGLAVRASSSTPVARGDRGDKANPLATHPSWVFATEETGGDWWS